MTVNSGGCGQATSSLASDRASALFDSDVAAAQNLTPDVGKSRRDSLLPLSGGLCGLSLLRRKLSVVNRPPSCSGLRC